MRKFEKEMVGEGRHIHRCILVCVLKFLLKRTNERRMRMKKGGREGEEEETENRGGEQRKGRKGERG
jgi:hypothetical protein